MSKIAIGMSGGVDSTLAAWLLKKQGHDVFGVTMSVWDPDCGGDFKGGCYGADEPEEISCAAKSAGQLGIKHTVIDLKAEYKIAVVDYFRKEYLSGRTPNPCVRCNRLLKLGLLLEKTRKACGEFDFFATGHYARIAETPSGRVLRKGADEKKDQSYFLWGLSRKQLDNLVFPLGELTKQETKKMAIEAGFPEVAALPESQDFIGGDYCGLFKPGESKPGPILNMSGKEIGRHDGIIHYTVGQRKGLGIGGLAGALYVASIDAKRNAVVVGTKKEVFLKTIKVGELNFTADNSKRLKAMAKIRRQHEPAPATINPPEKGVCLVEFEKPQFAPAPGQSAVFYDGDIVLGGGVIL
jgi:tRNA-specific 2-thiouridylase